MPKGVYKRTPEHYPKERNRKISQTMKGRIPRNVLRGDMKGDKNPSKRPEVREKISLFHKGKLRPEMKGENNPKWIKDRTKLKKSNEHRNDYAHREWSKNVKNRDNWKCRIADENCNGNLEAHHILGYTEHPELRYEINNGITLCHAHHPRKRAEEKRLSPYFQELVSVSKE